MTESSMMANQNSKLQPNYQRQYTNNQVLSTRLDDLLVAQPTLLKHRRVLRAHYTGQNHI